MASGKRRYAGCPLGGAKLIRYDLPITAKKSQIWLDISQISSTSEQLQLARAAAAAQCAPSKRQIWLYMALLSR